MLPFLNIRCSSGAARQIIAKRLLSRTPAQLSGHNKWSTIKHDKAKNDAEKNKISNKFSGAIAVAAREGGPDPTKNIRLATVIEAAQKANVMKRVIENAIKRGSGTGDNKKQLDQMVYEGVGPAGVAFVVEALTDNKNRTIGEVRACFTKFGGSLSPSLFNFDRKGYVVCELPLQNALTEDQVFDKVIECGGEDYEVYENDEEPTKDKDGNLIPLPKLLEVTTDPSDTGNATVELKKDFKIKQVGIAYIPKPDLVMKVEEVEVREKLDKLLQSLEDLDDVTDVYSNTEEN
ncbi:Dpc29 protein [Saccharomycopsis crataegensis]|uniref:Dpc29 protein n=1 Tax=Saccharomycopsis crataegensis TaxID=43959 RepID=A0AAV5QJS4_9ASCO|nr:Dpc29 protein [Saccharomycopsis crataegensis]